MTLTQEKEPKYFTKFRRSLDKKFDSIDKKFEKIDIRFDKIDETLNTHFEAIGEVKVAITEIQRTLEKKADAVDVRNLEKRTKVIEDLLLA